MITINLLPEEYRRANRTPLKVLVVMAVVVAVNGTLMALWAWKALGVMVEVDSRLAVLQSDLDTLRPRVEHHRSLERENKQFQAREETLARITETRVSWTEKLDQLVDVLNRGGDDAKYLIWLDDLKVTQTVDQRNDTGGQLTARSHSGSGNFALVAEFLEDLEVSELAEGFGPPGPPEGTRSSKDEGLMPSEIFSFNLSLPLLNPSRRDQ